MRSPLLLFPILAISLQATAQKPSRWQLIPQLQPELTFHQKSYIASNGGPNDAGSKTSLSFGLGAGIRYGISEKFFVQAGLNMVFRNMKGTEIMINRSEMYPGDSLLGPLLTIKNISLRTLEIPLTAGYYILHSPKGKLSLQAGYSFNYLLNVQYASLGTFKKQYWQGNAMLLGAGYTVPLTTKLDFGVGLLYSITNNVSSDRYIRKPDEKNTDLPHKFLKMNLGLEMRL